MSKELRAMLDSINAMKDEVKNLYAEDKDSEAETKMNDLEALQAKFDNLLKLEDTQIAAPVTPIDDRTDLQKFADSMRKKFTDMNETTPAAGGYTVPSDIQTQVNQYKKALVSMETLITVENVSEPTGSRVYQTKTKSPAFATVEEAAAYGAGTDPTFEQVNYSCAKRGAIFTVTDELLADSDANITGILAQWIAEGDVATTNAQVLAKLNALTATAIDGLDGIKNAVNVTLGQAYKNNATIVTNDSGLNYLDTLKDTNKRYVLTPDLATPGQLRLACGAVSLPIFVVPDAQLANPAEGSFPFFVGDFKEFMRKYDLRRYTIKQTDVATVGNVSAFENDLNYFKVTERNDFVQIDDDAVVRLTLTPAE